MSTTTNTTTTNKSFITNATTSTTTTTSKTTNKTANTSKTTGMSTSKLRHRRPKLIVCILYAHEREGAYTIRDKQLGHERHRERYKTIDIIAEYNHFTWECNHLPTFPPSSLETDREKLNS